uniref:Helo_like_N domain-containing protein n=1 Tax=Schistosoma curassoni TaxID=6186 RepID=A0A183JHG1_9TREM
LINYYCFLFQKIILLGKIILFKVAIVLLNRLFGHPSHRKSCQGLDDILMRLREVSSVVGKLDNFIREGIQDNSQQQDLLKETTMEDNWKGIKDALTSTCQLAPLNPPDIEAAHTDLLIDVTPPMTEDIRMAIRHIKNGKAAGPDNIPAEALKPDIEATAKILLVLLRKI